MRIRFGPYILDLDTRQLTRGSREIHLEPKAFDLLAALVRDRPKVLAKAALQERLWPATFVAEANLSNLVAEVREALGGSNGRGGNCLSQLLEAFVSKNGTFLGSERASPASGETQLLWR